MSSSARGALAHRPCAARAESPPLSPWYWAYLRSQDTLPEPAESSDDSTTPARLRAAAEAACSAGDLSAARQAIATAIDGFLTAGDSWGTADALAVQGSIARAAGDLRSAADSYRSALSAFTVIADLLSAARMYAALAEALFAAGEYDRAASVLLEALGRLPNEPVLLTGLGYAVWYGGHPADALAYLRQALDAGNDNRTALSGLGQIEADLGRAAAALADLDLALGLNHDASPEEDADIRSARALALAQLGQQTEADTEVGRALRLDPGNVRSLQRNGRIRLLHGDEEGARVALNSALATPARLPADEAAEAKRLLKQLSAKRR